MDGLIEKLLRLEGAKHKALTEIDASAYDVNVRKQMRLLARPKTQIGAVGDVEHVLALSQLITLNTKLLQNLVSTTPLFGITRTGYKAKARVAAASCSSSQ
jgi:hypothetical protein